MSISEIKLLSKGPPIYEDELPPELFEMVEVFNIEDLNNLRQQGRATFIDQSAKQVARRLAMETSVSRAYVGEDEDLENSTTLKVSLPETAVVYIS